VQMAASSNRSGLGVYLTQLSPLTGVATSYSILASQAT
jgi:hypothetical protein